MCAAAINCEKFSKPSFGGLRSFKVINDDKSKMPVTGACHIYAAYLYLHVYATVFTLDKPIAAK